jgi:membrane-associated phospholipid phosphatase
MDAARAPRDVFPSLHVAISALVWWYGARLGRFWFWGLSLPVFANWISTLYLRYHYLVDVLAGWVVAALAILLSAWLLRLQRLWQGSVPEPSANRRRPD